MQRSMINEFERRRNLSTQNIQFSVRFYLVYSETFFKIIFCTLDLHKNKHQIYFQEANKRCGIKRCFDQMQEPKCPLKKTKTRQS